MTLNDNTYMLRALQLAALGAGHVSPNPQVGAVIVSPEGRIIGEGWHRRYGEPHAEVNAVRSVAETDRHLLPLSTIYVTLEPCSHWGKTPPCAKLLIETGFRRVVVGILDPFKEVSGRGIRMLREAGIEVDTGVLEEECREINRRFITAHTQGRPYVMLKWAQTADGMLAPRDGRLLISNPLTTGEMHAERAVYDAILVGTGTVIADNPSLTVRERPGHSPRPVLFASPRIPADAAVIQRDPIILDPSLPLHRNLEILYRDHKVTSLMVEGGRQILDSFIGSSIFDEIRVETSPTPLGVPGTAAPALPGGLESVAATTLRGNRIEYFRPSKH